MKFFSKTCAQKNTNPMAQARNSMFLLLAIMGSFCFVSAAGACPGYPESNVFCGCFVDRFYI
jgi:hypothetical protein